MRVMIRIETYNKNHRHTWNEFIERSKNGLFLFSRDYMEYHADRFTDHSLLFFLDNKLIAVMPANIKNDTLYSHGGLTFGGIISDNKMRAPVMLKVFDTLKEYLAAQGIERMMYKAAPHIYHTVPAEEDLYVLFLHNARLARRDLSSTIPMDKKITFSKGRKWCIKKSKDNLLKVGSSYDFKTFMDIEEQLLLEKYSVRPTHTGEEMESLAGRFPENIKLFAAFKDSTMIAGVIIYESQNVAHAQYIASTDEGKKLFAVDFILDYLINQYYKQHIKKKYFDFGISTEKEGKELNIGLLTQKEEFGARSVVYDTYVLDV